MNSCVWFVIVVGPVFVVVGSVAGSKVTSADGYQLEKEADSAYSSNNDVKLLFVLKEEI